MKLQSLIKSLKFDYYDSNIIEKNFPIQKTKKDSYYRVFSFDRDISSEDIIKEMEKAGYRPANIYELLIWAKKNWNDQNSVVALGSIWQDLSGYRSVPVLDSDDAKRELDLDWFERDWDANYRFLAVRKYENSNSLNPLILERLKVMYQEVGNLIMDLKHNY